MSEMIVLTIGPVQSYISQARRTQDLWQGSRILSYLAGAGVAYANGEELAEVVYPVIPVQDNDDEQRDQPANIPNRIVVRWFGDHAGARACADQMQAEIENAWKRISDNTFNYFMSHNELLDPDNIMSGIWQRQEQNWLECYWVVVPENSASHADNMRRANNTMGARKLMRNFQQSHERGIKCSITGEHEILHDGRRMAEWSEFWKDIRANQRNRALLGEHERLSAISTIKRFAHEEVKDENGLWHPINPALAIMLRFPSTSSIAAVPFKHDVLAALADNEKDQGKREELERMLRAFIEVLLVLFEDPAIRNPDERRRKAERLLFFTKHGELNPEYFPLIYKNNSVISSYLSRQFLSIDGDFLFEDTLISKTIEEYSGRKPDQQQIQEAQKALKALIGAAQKLDIPKPQPYLVVLSMDGDHMGRTLGELLDADQHRNFSAALADFARVNVMEIVEETHLGRVVYAGGDDVLALLPVRDALAVAEKLRTTFETMLNNTKILDYNRDVISVHVSTGLAYVHHTHNLQDAVRAAGDAQKHIAKEDLERNAIGLKLLKRSGKPREMGQKWNIGATTLYEHVDTLTYAFSTHLSRNLPYDIAQIAYSMTGNGVTDAACEAELRRVLKRRLPRNLEDKERIVHDLSDHILALVRGVTGNVEAQWQNAQCWLELARFIAQKESGA